MEPNEGSTWFVGQAVAAPGEPPAKLGHEAFHAAPHALDFLRRLSAADRDRALVHMQSWLSGRHRLAASAPAGALRVTPRSGWPFMFFGTSQRYHVENVAVAFNHPGEWIGSGADGVRYLRRIDETATLNVELPLLHQLVIVRGSGPAGPSVEHLTLRDLGFAYTRSPTPAGGWVDGQAASDISAAIQVRLCPGSDAAH